MTSFRIIRKEIVEQITKSGSARPRVGLVLFSITRNVAGVRTEHHARAEGRSGYSLSRLVGDFVDNILNYSPRLLRRLGYMGLVSILVAAALTAFVASSSTVLLVLILLTPGLVLTACGIVGEYRWRTMHSGDCPLYVVGESLN